MKNCKKLDDVTIYGTHACPGFQTKLAMEWVIKNPDKVSRVDAALKKEREEAEKRQHDEEEEKDEDVDDGDEEEEGSSGEEGDDE